MYKVKQESVYEKAKRVLESIKPAMAAWKRIKSIHKI
jgi:hypothetical protein